MGATNQLRYFPTKVIVLNEDVLSFVSFDLIDSQRPPEC